MAIVGAGTIGVGWAVAFARGGVKVALHDAASERLDAVSDEITTRLRELAEFGLLGEDPGDASARLSVQPDLEAAVAAASHVQECVPERFELKRELFKRLVPAAPADAVLASSTSSMVPSRLFAGMRTRERCIVAHPANPPHLLPVVELVPAPFTDESALRRTESLLHRIGMSPIRLRRELEGFVFNRLQGALLREAYCLVRDGVVSVDGIDELVREGLGRRWSVTGPFETADLNHRGGIAAHAATMGDAYARMGRERGQDDPWSEELIASVNAQRRRRLPLEGWEQRVAWRDRQLMALERARRTGAIPAA